MCVLEFLDDICFQTQSRQYLQGRPCEGYHQLPQPLHLTDASPASGQQHNQIAVRQYYQDQTRVSVLLWCRGGGTSQEVAAQSPQKVNRSGLQKVYQHEKGTPDEDACQLDRESSSPPWTFHR